MWLSILTVVFSTIAFLRYPDRTFLLSGSFMNTMVLEDVIKRIERLVLFKISLLNGLESDHRPLFEYNCLWHSSNLACISSRYLLISCAPLALWSILPEIGHQHS
ncbi:hypothetical protein [Ascidiimonas aurantiaca]|uniref:hypothetical protein n=1 Tax=Ascidiimonas aurantiaca TaxID=1685432 RepID=UPI0030EF8B7C